jgi:hypothetical protein
MDRFACARLRQTGQQSRRRISRRRPERSMSKYVLMDLRRTILYGMAFYWKVNKNGYTTDKKQAGRYGEWEAKLIAAEDVDGDTIAIPAEKLE